MCLTLSRRITSEQRPESFKHPNLFSTEPPSLHLCHPPIRSPHNLSRSQLQNPTPPTDASARAHPALSSNLLRASPGTVLPRTLRPGQRERRHGLPADRTERRWPARAAIPMPTGSRGRGWLPSMRRGRVDGRCITALSTILVVL